MEASVRSFLAGSVFILVVLISGCGLKEKKGTSAGVSLVFAKKESTNLTEVALTDATEGFVLGQNLSTLKIKPIAVAVSAELNSNKYMIWGSKSCLGKEHEIKINDKKYKYFVYEEICSANDADEYLDMLDPVALNTTLNSQVWPVPPGTYKYISLIFCSRTKSESIKNLAYRAPKMTEDNEFTHCDPFIGVNEAGIVVPEGGSITVKLTYDLDSLIDYLEHSSDMPPFDTTGAIASGCYRTSDALTQYCPKFGRDALVPSIAN